MKFKKLIIYILPAFWLILTVNRSTKAQDSTQTGSESTVKKELNTRVAVSQVSFTNWAKGGDNMVTYTSSVEAGLSKDRPGYNWLVHGDFIFGQTKQGDQKNRNTLDKIDIDANIIFKKKKLLNPYFSFTLSTQFAKGYDYKMEPPEAKSDIFDPAYLVQSIGIGIIVKPKIQNKMGFAVKETFTRSFRQYSDNPNTADKIEWLKIEPGITSRTDLSYPINKNTEVTSKLILFSNLKSFKDIDFRWDSNFQAKLARYFSVNFSVYFLYDSDISKKTQIKQFLGIGFIYSFF